MRNIKTSIHPVYSTSFPRTVLFFAVAAASMTTPALAIDIFWTGLGRDDSFFTPSNWSPPIVPGPNDQAVFPSGTHTVTFEEAQVANTLGLRIEDADVTFEFHPLALYEVTGIIEVGLTDGQLTLTKTDLHGYMVASQQPSQQTANEVIINAFGGGIGAERVTNGSTLTVLDLLIVGRQGRGILTIDAGGKVDAEDAKVRVAYDNGSGDSTVRVTGVGSTLTSFDLVIGRKAKGILTLDSGGKVDAVDGCVVIAQDAGSDESAVSVSGIQNGTRSSLTGNAFDLVVGNEASGKLTIDSGATVSKVDEAIISLELGSAGSSVTVKGVQAGIRSEFSGGTLLVVGSRALGTLSIESGGKVEFDQVVVAEEVGSQGSAVTVKGSQGGTRSELTNPAGGFGLILVVGGIAQGTLTIDSGGRVDAGDGFVSIAENVGSQESAVVVKMNSEITGNSFSLNVGGEAKGTLTVESGSEVSGVGELVIACDPGSQESALTISGVGTELSGNGSCILVVGEGAKGFLTVDSGGKVSGFDQVIVADAVGSQGSNVTVTGVAQGTRSELSAGNGGLFVGGTSMGKLTIDAGGIVVVGSDGVQIAEEAGAQGSSVEVKGAANGMSSELKSSGDIFIGISPQGGVAASLNVNQGGKVVAKDGNTLKAVTVFSRGEVTGDKGSIEGKATIKEGGKADPGVFEEEESRGSPIAVGELTVIGEYTQEGGGILAIELDADSQSDLLDVEGTALFEIGAVLELGTLPGFQADEFCQTWIPLTADSIVLEGSTLADTFANVMPGDIIMADGTEFLIELVPFDATREALRLTLLCEQVDCEVFETGSTDARVNTEQTPATRTQNSVAIAVSRANPNFLMACFQEYPLRASGSRVLFNTSTNGGASFNTSTLVTPGPTAGILDVEAFSSVAFDLSNNAYLAYAASNNDTDANGIFVSKLPDGQRAFLNPVPAAMILWENPITVHVNPRIVVDDKRGANNGNVYVAWTHATNAGVPPIMGPDQNVMFSRSVNYKNVTANPTTGVIFSHPFAISDATLFMNQGAAPALGSGGEVYVAWYQQGSAAPVGRIMVDRSTDGGFTFGTDKMVESDVQHFPPDDPAGPVGNGANFRAPTALSVSCAVDRGGPFNGRIYVVWHAQDADPDLDDSNVWVAALNPNLSIAVAPARVSVPLAIDCFDQLMPRVAVNGNGKVGVLFYSRTDNSTGLVDVFFALSEDGGATFAQARRVNERGSINGNAPILGGLIPQPLLGDYIGLAAGPMLFHAAWADTRDGLGIQTSNMDIWSDRINPTDFPLVQLPVPGDLNGDGIVGIGDLQILLAEWGPCKGCPTDFDGNDDVGVSDLLILLANWGPCP